MFSEINMEYLYIQDEKETGEDSGNDTTLTTANSKLSLAACNAVDRQYVSYVSNVKSYMHCCCHYFCRETLFWCTIS